MSDKTTWDGIAKLTDVFFNKRSATSASSVTIAELIRREVSHIRYNGKIYKIEVKEVEAAK